MSDARAYEDIASINVNEYVEKKGGLSYLSWSWAVDQLLRLDQDANWAYGEPLTCPDGTMLVFCTVTAFGRARTIQLPVMDYKNKPIPNPDAFAINTAMQRCLVKAIALHGLGLYIYAGEDLPPGETQETEQEITPDPRIDRLMADFRAIAEEGVDALKEVWSRTPLEQRELIGVAGLAELKRIANR